MVRNVISAALILDLIDSPLQSSNLLALFYILNLKPMKSQHEQTMKVKLLQPFIYFQYFRANCKSFKPVCFMISNF